MAAPRPIRIPVKEPGPVEAASTSRSARLTEASAKTRRTSSMSLEECESPALTTASHLTALESASATPHTSVVVSIARAMGGFI